MRDSAKPKTPTKFFYGRSRMSSADSKAKRYSVIKNRIALLEPLLFLAFLAVIQLSGISRNIKEFSLLFSSQWYVTIALYAVIFSFLHYIITFYLNFYRSYIIEHRFGLSNQGLSDWIKDELKRGLLSLALFILFIEFLYLVLRNSPDLWWLLLALGWVAFSIVLAKIFPVLIIPLFFKYERFTDEEFKKRLMRLAKKCGVKILDVFKLRLSSKTKKANAALTGIGKTRRVILGDTLLDNYTKNEVEVVLAHELAHHKLAHIWKTVLFGGLSITCVFYLVKLSSSFIIDMLHIEGVDDITAFPSIMFAISFFSILATPLQNAFSRRLERAADSTAIEITGLPQAFISCMNKLAEQNLADPAPSKFIEVMLYDHPPISKRVAMAEDIKNKM